MWSFIQTGKSDQSEPRRLPELFTHPAGSLLQLCRRSCRRYLEAERRHDGRWGKRESSDRARLVNITSERELISPVRLKLVHVYQTWVNRRQRVEGKDCCWSVLSSRCFSSKVAQETRLYFILYLNINLTSFFGLFFLNPQHCFSLKCHNPSSKQSYALDQLGMPH